MKGKFEQYFKYTPVHSENPSKLAVLDEKCMKTRNFFKQRKKPIEWLVCTNCSSHGLKLTCTGYSNRNDTGTHTQRTYMCCTLHHHTVCIMEVVYTTCPMKSSMQQQHYKVHSGICVHRTSSMKASMQQQQYKRGVSWNSCSPNLLKYQCIAISRIMQQSYRRQGPHSYLAEGMTKKSRISAILR
eukprot:scpid104413/ scgid6235/ 